MSNESAITAVARRKHCPSCGVVIGLDLPPEHALATLADSDIRIGVSTPRRFNPVSWLIRKIMGAEVSHTFFVYYDVDLHMDCVLEAHELGFRIIPLKRFQKRNKIFGMYRVNVPLTDGLVWMGEWIGSAYDYTGLLGMAWVMIGRLLKRKFKNPLNSGKAMFCSEMVLSVLTCCNVPWVRGFDAATTTPQDIYLLLDHNAVCVFREAT